ADRWPEWCASPYPRCRAMLKASLLPAVILSTAALTVGTGATVPYEPTRPLKRAQLEDVELEYEIGGASGGEPVLLIHAGVLADWFVPLMTQPDLAERYQLIRYHRIGYAGSSRPPGPVSIQEQAAHARKLLEHLGIQRAHIVGHSSSADIALQLALDTA